MKRIMPRMLALLLLILLVGGVLIACNRKPSQGTESGEQSPENLPDYFDGKPYRIDFLKDIPAPGIVLHGWLLIQIGRGRTSRLKFRKKALLEIR